MKSMIDRPVSDIPKSALRIDDTTLGIPLIDAPNEGLYWIFTVENNEIKSVAYRFLGSHAHITEIQNKLLTLTHSQARTGRATVAFRWSLLIRPQRRSQGRPAKLPRHWIASLTLAMTDSPDDSPALPHSQARTGHHYSLLTAHYSFVHQPAPPDDSQLILHSSSLHTFCVVFRAVP
jgi:hypothetical protein